MKNKRLIISTVIFFLTVNTTYYWESKLGIFAFPVFLILAVVYFVLVIALLRQIYFVVKEKFSDKTQLLIIGFLTLLLTLTFFRPFGIVNFNKLERGDILVAEREGAVNCMTTFKLKDNFTFSERNICFGVTEIKGKYYLQYDTIFFDNVELGRHENSFYKFAVVRPSKFKNDGKHFDLIRYNSLKDTIGHELWITKNELNKLKDIKPNR